MDYCVCKKIERGQDELLMCNDVNGKDGNILNRQELSFGIERDDEGNYYLNSKYYDGTKVASKVRVDIQYCPWCGEKLQSESFKRIGTIK